MEKAMATHSSTLAWKIPWAEEPGRLQSMASRRVRHDFTFTFTFTFTFHFHALWKEMATHSSVLAWRIPGTGEPGGLPSMGSHRVGHDWSDLAAAAYIYVCMDIVQFGSVAQSCPTHCNPMDCSTPGFPVHHQLPKPTQTHVHQIGDVIQPSHPLSSPSPPTFNPFQDQGLFKRVSSLHQVAKVLEFQLQHLSFQWIFRTDFL